MSQVPKAKMNIPMCAACILLCLTLFSIYLAGGLYAKYVNYSGSGDTARVAAFSVDVVPADNTLVTISVSKGEDKGTYEFDVVNESEVAVKYDILLTFAEDLPDYLGVTLNGAVGNVLSPKEIMFENAGTIAPNAGAVNNSLVFKVDVDDYLSGAVGESYTYNIGFAASVRCEQID